MNRQRLRESPGSEQTSGRFGSSGIHHRIAGIRNGMNSPRPALDFWFEFASTYTYIAAMHIEESCRAADVELRWKPFMLGPIFALQGWNDSHYNLNPRRGAYMWRDMERLTRKLGLPWRKPSSFPRGTTLAARIACANAGEPWIGNYIRDTFVANFGNDRDVGDAAVLSSILSAVRHDGGRALDAAAIIERATSPESRALLRTNTERAIELGIFGSPNCVVGDELFWGEESVADAIEFAREAGDSNSGAGV